MKLSVKWLLLCGICAVLGLHGELVYRASYDLVSNEALNNPYTNVVGGVWEYMVAPRDGLQNVSKRTLMLTKQEQMECVHGLGLRLKDQIFGVPHILVNLNYQNTQCGVLTSNIESPLHPSEVMLHPGSLDEDAYGVLRFNVPRTATYTVKFTYRTLVPTDGKVNVYALKNGEIIFSQCLDRSQRGDDYSVYANYELTSEVLQAGDILEIAVEMADQIYNDGVMVDMIVNETDDGMWYDPLKIFAEHIDEVNDIYAGERNDKWQVQSAWGIKDTAKARNAVLHYTNVFENVIGGETKTIYLPGGNNTNDFQQTYPYFVLNTNDFAVLPSDVWKQRCLLPCEALAHPGLYMRSIHHVFMPEEAGFYDLYATARDLSSGNVDIGAGVWVAFIRDREILAQQTISIENSNYPASTTLVATNVFLFAREQIDLVVESGDWLYCDATGVKWMIHKRSRGLPNGVISVNQSFVENAQQAGGITNPYTDKNGVVWSSGCAKDFPKFTYLDNWKNNLTSNGGMYLGWQTDSFPLTCIYLGNEITTAEEFKPYSSGEGRGDIVPYELLMHPGNKYYWNVTRAVIPNDGVWNIRSLFRHLNRFGDGVDTSVILRHKDILACAKQIKTEPVKRLQASDDLQRVTLKKGDTVDFVIGDGPSGVYNYDLSSLQAFMTYSCETTQVVNVDFQTSSASKFASNGRLGSADDTFWNVLKITEVGNECACSNLWTSGHTQRTAVTVSVTGGNADITIGDIFTDEAVNTLMADGLAMTNRVDAGVWCVGGLIPNSTYYLALYGSGIGQVIVDGKSEYADKSWFSRADECAVFKAVANSDGEISGTFLPRYDSTPTSFTGLQIEGVAFADYVPLGTVLFIR